MHHAPQSPQTRRWQLFLPAVRKPGSLPITTQPAGSEQPFPMLCTQPLLREAPDSHAGDVTCQPATYTPTTNQKESWTWAEKGREQGPLLCSPHRALCFQSTLGESSPDKEGEVWALFAVQEF